MGVENIDNSEELKRLEQQIESASDLAALKPIYFRLNEIMQASPGDFDVQFTGNELKQHLMARGAALKQQGASAPAPLASPPAVEAVKAPASSAPPRDAPPPGPGAPAGPGMAFGGPSPEFPLFPMFASASPPPPAAPSTASPAHSLGSTPPPLAEPPMPAPPAQPAYFAGFTPPRPAAPPKPTPPVQPAHLDAPAPPPPAAQPKPVPIADLFTATAPHPPAAAPEPPAPPAYFADTMSPPPAAPPKPAGAQSALPVTLFYPSVDAALPEPPLPSLAVTPGQPPPPPIPPAAAAPTPPAESPAELAPDWSSRLAALFAPDPLAPAADAAPAMPAEPSLPPAAPFLEAAPASPQPDSPAPAPAETPAAPPPPARPPAPPRAPFEWKRALLIAAAAVLLIAVVAVGAVLYRNHARSAREAARNGAAVQVEISTTPPGASVKVVPQGSAGGAASACTANCTLSLAPGAYEITATIDGFDPATSVYTVRAAQPATLSLMLQPQAPSVRLLTDLEQGKVVVDGQPPVDLQDGQLVLDKVAPGPHTMKIAGPNGDASLAFSIAAGELPAFTGPVAARNMVAILVASFGKRARIVTNAGPWKLAVNGQPQGDASPGGTDITGFQPGVNEIVIGEGGDLRNMSESFGAAPTLTAFLKTDVNAGTLIVSTGLDDVRVFVNGKEYKLRTQHGKLRMQTLGKVAVRVVKSGFQDAPEQTAEVKKGAEVRLQFDLRPQPQFGSLEIRGAIAGTEVLIDQRSVGTVGPDGLFSVSAIQPGEHSIELRRSERLPKRLQRSFPAGQAVVLGAADVALATANGTVRITSRNPASATVAYRRAEETDTREVRGSQIELPAGNYVFSASAPGFGGSVTRVQIAAGDNREVAFNLQREGPAAPVPLANAMAEFQDAQSWTKDGDSWVHKGGGFVPFKPSPKGIFTFNVELLKGGSVLRAGTIRWCLQYVDPKNYLLFEMDKKNFRAWVIKDGQRLERVPKTPHNLGTGKSFTIQIEVTPDRLLQKVRGGEGWKPLDTFAEPGRDFTQGKFAFLIQGTDEIAISNFQFVPR